jgi:hypothetical protein
MGFDTSGGQLVLPWILHLHGNNLLSHHLVLYFLLALLLSLLLHLANFWALVLVLGLALNLVLSLSVSLAGLEWLLLNFLLKVFSFNIS